MAEPLVVIDVDKLSYQQCVMWQRLVFRSKEYNRFFISKQWKYGIAKFNPTSPSPIAWWSLARNSKQFKRETICIGICFKMRSKKWPKWFFFPHNSSDKMTFTARCNNNLSMVAYPPCEYSVLRAVCGWARHGIYETSHVCFLSISNTSLISPIIVRIIIPFSLQFMMFKS